MISQSHCLSAELQNQVAECSGIQQAYPPPDLARNLISPDDNNNGEHLLSAYCAPSTTSLLIYQLPYWAQHPYEGVFIIPIFFQMKQRRVKKRKN